MLNQQKRFLSYINSLEQVLASCPIPLAAKNELPSLKQRILDIKLAVPVIGPFSAGKSTLINEFLGEAILPVGIAPETELATELHFSHDPFLLAIKKDGTEERFSVDALADVNRRSAEFLLLCLYLNNHALQSIAPLVLVDMPGFGSSLENHTKAIEFYIPQGVHFLVVISIEDGSITKFMLHQLDEIRSYGTGFTFLLSKSNLRAAEQVQEVREYIQEQLESYFGDKHAVIPVGAGDGQPLNTALRSLDPEAIFAALFVDNLKNQHHNIIDQINLALHTLKQDALQRKASLDALERTLRTLETQRDDTLHDIRSRFSRNTLDKCLKNIDSALNNILEECVNLILRKDNNGFLNLISSAVRSTLMKTIRLEIESVSKVFISRIVENISLDQGNMLDIDGKIWAEELGNKVTASLRDISKVLDSWKEKINSNEKLYKIISTILAVTTNIVFPIIELLIIFLPEIVRFFTAGNEREQIRQKLLVEIFPSIKAELRQHLPQELDQELERLLDAINQDFSTKIKEQQQVISAFHEEHAADNEERIRRQKNLEESKSVIQNLATEYLYSMEAQ